MVSAPQKLIADAMLGALVRWLRALDLDVFYDPELDDPEIVELAVAEDRTILTRDRRLTERRAARNHLLKLQGHHSARDFADRLNRAIADGTSRRTLGEEVE